MPIALRPLAGIRGSDISAFIAELQRVITMAMYAKIRRMYFCEHLTISEIQRRTSLSRNTIKKWFKETGEPRYQRPKRDSRLTPFKPKIQLALETDAHRPRRDRRTALTSSSRPT